MPDSASEIPDDVPIADAAEQQRSTGEDLSDDAFPAGRAGGHELPLEASAADWQEQHETVFIEPDYDAR